MQPVSTGRMLFVIAAGIVCMSVLAAIGALVLYAANAMFGKAVATLLLAGFCIWALRAWWKGRKARYLKVAAKNEMEWLEELADEHEQGAIDNREKLRHLITIFEERNEDAFLYKRRLDNVRRIIGDL
jgi:hypothetical protein